MEPVISIYDMLMTRCMEQKKQQQMKNKNMEIKSFMNQNTLPRLTKPKVKPATPSVDGKLRRLPPHSVTATHLTKKASGAKLITKKEELANFMAMTDDFVNFKNNLQPSEGSSTIKNMGSSARSKFSVPGEGLASSASSQNKAKHGKAKDSIPNTDAIQRKKRIQFKNFKSAAKPTGILKSIPTPN